MLSRQGTNRSALIALLVLVFTFPSTSSMQIETAPNTVATGEGTFEIIAVGEFHAFICPWTQGGIERDAAITTAQEDSVAFTLSVCYLDTVDHRSDILIHLSASPLSNGKTGSSIPASNIYVRGTTAVIMNNVHEGDTYEGSPILAMGSIDPEAEGNLAITSWDGDVSLEQPVLIAVAAEGSGSSMGNEADVPNDSHTGQQDLNVEIVIPAGSEPGTYTTEFTLEITPIIEN